MPRMAVSEAADAMRGGSDGRRGEDPTAMRPEERMINDYAVVQASVVKLVNGMAFLALTWSTVVLLGGFVSDLFIKDFWLLTVMSLVLASRVLTVYEYEDGVLKAAESVHNGFSKKLSRTVLRSHLTAIILGVSTAMIQLFGLVLAIIYLFGPMLCIVASVVRLMQKDHGGTKVSTKVSTALDIFYSVALAQGVLFYLWVALFWTEPCRTAAASRLCKFGPWGIPLIKRYLQETKACCAKDLALPASWNLVTFAVSLMASESWDDQLSGARMLDTFVHRRQIPEVRLHVVSSGRCVQNLMAAMGRRGQGHREIRERASRIVADVADEIIIAQFPGALQCISSLLEFSDPRALQLPPEESPGSSLYSVGTKRKDMVGRRRNTGAMCLLYLIYNTKVEATERRGRDYEGSSFVSQEAKELILQGLLILERLAHDQHNHREICNDEALLSKITLPMNSLAFDTEHDDTLVDVLNGSMRVVAKLVKSPGEAGRRLCHEIGSNEDVFHGMMCVLKGDKRYAGAQGVKERSMEILTEVLVTLDIHCMRMASNSREDFIRMLLSIFLGDDKVKNHLEVNQEEEEEAIQLRGKAGEELVQLLSVESVSNSVDILEIFWGSGPAEAITPLRERCAVVDQLTEMLSVNMMCRLSAAEILENFLCYHPATQRLNVKEPLINLLTKIIEEILCIEMEAEPNADADAQVEANNFAPIHDVENQCASNVDGYTSSSPVQEQSEKRKFLSSLLSITTVLCDRLMDASDFARVVHMVFPDDSFVKKLKDIVEINCYATADCLRVVKLTCELIIPTVRCTTIFIRDLEKHKFMESLSKALRIMSYLDNYMLFVHGHHKKMNPSKSLYSLVKEARDIVQENEI